MSDYAEFLDSKRMRVASVGHVDAGEPHELLFPFQRDLVKWAVRKGRAALFADTGLGKTFMQLEWARLIGGRVLIVAPDEVSNDDWIEWARPIWYGIRESATLNAAEARDQADERHIAALQLETVRRCILLWSNAGDVILDPFTGIGTTGYVAVQNGRQFVGCELKRSYYEAACRNIARASNVQTLGLFETVA